jgi:nucleotidyltransferase/DNA polymerase involved in DNA repair
VARLIFHVDMDAFFVSVEELYDPSLKGKPVVVGGRGDQRGVVSAASYAARKFGIHSAMPLRTASSLCPHAVFVEGHPDRYREYSKKVAAVMEAHTPLVEMASIDEAYLDMTGTERLHGPPLAAAHKLHEAIRAETGLNNSIGASGSRLVSKVESERGQGDRGVAACVRHPEGWRPGATGREVSGTEVRQVGAGAGGEEPRGGRRGMVRRRDWGGRGSEIGEPRAYIR